MLCNKLCHGIKYSLMFLMYVGNLEFQYLDINAASHRHKMYSITFEHTLNIYRPSQIRFDLSYLYIFFMIYKKYLYTQVFFINPDPLHYEIQIFNEFFECKKLTTFFLYVVYLFLILKTGELINCEL